MRRVLFCLILLLGASAAWSASSQPGTLSDSEALYAAGDYAKAARRLETLLIQDNRLPPETRARVYLMKARLELAFGHQTEIHLWLAKAHASFPQLALDPVRDPPSLIASWNELAAAPVPSQPAPVEAASHPGRFAAGLLPLGFGHLEFGRARDGALFLSTESLVALAASTQAAGPKDGALHPKARLLGGAALLGAYGYELLDVLPELTQASAGGGAVVGQALTVLPFGVGQARNGDVGKAFAFAAAELTTLSAAALTNDGNQRRNASALFAAIWALGGIDAALHQGQAAAGSVSLQIVPTVVGSVHLGSSWTTQVTYGF